MVLASVKTVPAPTSLVCLQSSCSTVDRYSSGLRCHFYRPVLRRGTDTGETRSRRQYQKFGVYRSSRGRWEGPTTHLRTLRLRSRSTVRFGHGPPVAVTLVDLGRERSRKGYEEGLPRPDQARSAGTLTRSQTVSSGFVTRSVRKGGFVHPIFCVVARLHNTAAETGENT